MLGFGIALSGLTAGGGNSGGDYNLDPEVWGDEPSEWPAPWPGRDTGGDPWQIGDGMASAEYCEQYGCGQTLVNP